MNSMLLRKRKRIARVAPRPRRRRQLAEDEELDADQLAIGPGDKPSGEGG